MLTQDRLKELIVYDPETGDWQWRATGKGRRLDRFAGRVNPGTGYREIYIDGRNYQAHRLAFLYMLGRWPAHHVDHLEVGFSSRSDTRWGSLREATPSQNHANTKVPRNNTSGYRGVCRHGRKWSARAMIDGVVQNLGLFDKAEDAAACVASVRVKHFGDFART